MYEHPAAAAVWVITTLHLIIIVSAALGVGRLLLNCGLFMNVIINSSCS